MNLLLAYIPVNKLRPDMQTKAHQAKAVDGDGFVIIEKRYCANPLKANKIYSQRRKVLVDMEVDHDKDGHN